MAGSFFQGLAKGVFASQADLNRQAYEEQENERRGTLKFLMDLEDKVDDESKPLLYRQMADVMKLKGKSRNFWDELTGQGRWAGRDALREKGSDILSMLASPSEMTKLRPHAEVTQVGAGGYVPGVGMIPSIQAEMTPDQSQNRIGLRSEIDDKERLMRAQYGLQTTAAMERLVEKERLMGEREASSREDRQNFEREMTARKEEMKMFGEVRKRAAERAGRSGRTTITDADLIEASNELAAERGLKSEALQELVGLRKAMTQAKLAETQGLGDGLTPPGKPLTQNQRISLDQAQQAKAEAMFKEWSASRAEAIAAGQELQSLYNSLSAQAGQYGLAVDATNNKIVTKDGSPMNAMQTLVVPELTKALQKAASLNARKVEAEAKMGDRQRALVSGYGEYYSSPSPWWVEPIKTFGGVAPAGAPRTLGGGGATPAPSSGNRILDVGKSAAYTTTNDHNVGDEIQVGPNVYRVDAVLGREGMDKKYKVTRLK